MSHKENNKEITMNEQMRNFMVKSMYGFQTILCYGLGKRLGIFDYLNRKANSEINQVKLSSISFTVEDLSENLKLGADYLEAWLHMSIVCGLFEIDDSYKRCAKTAPYVFELLINSDSMFYIGDILGNFYNMAQGQDLMIEGFKKGTTIRFSDVAGDMYKEGQKASARFGTLVERLFAKCCKEDKRKLSRGAKVLEVGCGYGFNLANWAKKYKKTYFTGIDIDPNGIAHAKKLVDEYNWDDRVKVVEIPIEKFVKSTDTKFDVIILNMVLHEMEPDESYRIEALNNLYHLLKDEGLLIIGDTIVPDTFDITADFQLYDIMHKWFEVSFGSRFYDEITFQQLINSTPFTRTELIREGGIHFWAIRK